MDERGKERFLKLVGKELQRCAKCGACLSVCPVFSEAPQEKFSARGKIALCEAATAGEIPVSEGFRDIIGNCLLCLACSEGCSSGVDVEKIVLAARAELTRADEPSARDGGPADDGFEGIPENSGLRLRISSLLRNTEPPAAPAFLRQQTPEIFDVSDAVDTIILFPGCFLNYLYPGIAGIAVRLLNNLKVRVVAPKDQECCGATVAATGDIDEARSLAEKNIAALSAAGRGHKIVTLCASCGYMLKHKYPNLFPEDGYRSQTAKALASRTYDISQYLVRVIGLEKISCRIEKKAPNRLTYHAPCHLKRGQKILTEPKDLLKLACKDNFVEMTDEEVCCGAGLGYNRSHENLSKRILSGKIDNILASGAQDVATGCPGCMMQLSRGLRTAEKKISVLHTVEVLARAMGVD